MELAESTDNRLISIFKEMIKAWKRVLSKPFIAIPSQNIRNKTEVYLLSL
jgi:hypothetical protein